MPVKRTVAELERLNKETGLWMENFPCRKCGAQTPTAAGHDPCIADLPGVAFACCGHGSRRGGYIYFTNGTLIRGLFRDFEYSK
jgi:hypothetical protein